MGIRAEVTIDSSFKDRAGLVLVARQSSGNKAALATNEISSAVPVLTMTMISSSEVRHAFRPAMTSPSSAFSIGLFLSSGFMIGATGFRFRFGWLVGRLVAELFVQAIK